jgi:hypothetical protein
MSTSGNIHTVGLQLAHSTPGFRSKLHENLFVIELKCESLRLGSASGFQTIGRWSCHPRFQGQYALFARANSGHVALFWNDLVLPPRPHGRIVSNVYCTLACFNGNHFPRRKEEVVNAAFLIEDLPITSAFPRPRDVGQLWVNSPARTEYSELDSNYWMWISTVLA